MCIDNISRSLLGDPPLSNLKVGGVYTVISIDSQIHATIRVGKNLHDKDSKEYYADRFISYHDHLKNLSPNQVTEITDLLTI